MTRVDFHFNTPDKYLYACRLLRKVSRTGNRTVVFCDDTAQLRDFDQLLWSFSKEEFIPHVMADSPLASVTPIILATTVTETDHHDVIVNLGSVTPPHFSRFERLLEVVANDENDRAAARERWRFYRDRGYQLERFDQTGK